MTRPITPQRSANPARDVALTALGASPLYEGDMLEEVLTYCWEQLKWRRNDRELVELRASLRMEGDEEEADASDAVGALRDIEAAIHRGNGPLARDNDADMLRGIGKLAEHVIAKAVQP